MLRTVFGDDAAVLDDADFRLLLLGTVAAPLGPSLLSPILDTLTGPFGVGSARIGLLLSAYTAPAIVVIPLAGILADRYGRKPVLVAGLCLFGVAGTAIAFTTDFRVVLGLRLLQGVGGSGIVPVIITATGDLFSGTREATAQGLRFSVSGLSQAVFPLVAGVAVAVAWQYPILLYAISLPIAALVALFLDEPREIDAAGAADASPEAVTDGSGGDRPDLRRLLRQPRVLSIAGARLLPPFAYFGFLTYNSVIVVRGLSGSPAQAGLLVALSSTVMAISASQSGRLTSLFGNRLYPLLAANASLGVGLGLVAFAPSLPVAIAGTLLLGAGFGPVLSLYRSLITGLTGPHLRGSLVSITESGGRIGSTGAPIALGALVAFLEPSLGLVGAVRWAAFAAGAVGAGGGVGFVLLFFAAPPVAVGDGTGAA